MRIGDDEERAADTAEASCITLVWISSSNHASPRPPQPPRAAVRAGENFTAAAAEAMAAATVTTGAPEDVASPFSEELLPAQGVVGQPETSGGVDGRDNFLAESEPLSLLRRESHGPLEAAGFSVPPSNVAETGTGRDDCCGMEDRHSGTCKEGEAHPQGNARAHSDWSFSLGDGQRHEWLPETAPPLRDGWWDDVARSENPWDEATASAAQPSAAALPRRASTAACPHSSLDGNGLAAESLDARMRGALVDNFCRYRAKVDLCIPLEIVEGGGDFECYSVSLATTMTTCGKVGCFIVDAPVISSRRCSKQSGAFLSRATFYDSLLSSSSVFFTRSRAVCTTSGSTSRMPHIFTIESARSLFSSRSCFFAGCC